MRQFPLRVVHDVVGFLTLVGVLHMCDDAGGVLVAPPHIKPLLLAWAAAQGFSELDAHTAIGQ